VGWLCALAAVGCGSTTPQRSSSAWCPKLTILSEGREKAPGHRATSAHVDAINARYQRAILRNCPGLVSVGVSDAAIIRAEAQGKRHLPPASKLHESVIIVGVKSKKDLPHSPVFLRGVRLLFQVTPGLIRLDNYSERTRHP
jgi:hypothetical protein